MTATGILRIHRIIPRGQTATVTLNRRMFLHLVIGISSFTGGLLLAVMGLSLWIFTYFQLQRFHGLDVVMLITSFVLLAIGAHSFDKIERPGAEIGSEEFLSVTTHK